VVEIFKQTAFNPIPVEIQASIIWAVQNGYFDDIEVKQIVGATTSLRESFETRGAKLMDKIRSEKVLSEPIEAELKKAIEEWKAGFSA
jgi:F-type H+-transporting ATPase subunit alpha